MFKINSRLVDALVICITLFGVLAVMNAYDFLITLAK